MTANSADIAVIGLAVMGQNLILNMADHGHTVVAYNRTTSKVKEFIEGPAQGKSIVGAYSLTEMLAPLKSPRRIMFMVKAGAVVDSMIAELLPLLQPGDILIDGGNSHYPDTERRIQELAAHGVQYVGSGISGGEEGARRGPSIMPGGDAQAWPFVKDIFQSIAAKTPAGDVCCDWVGNGGSGHFVKMVHNGIEYGDMQLIAEAWDLLRRVGGLSDAEIAATFAEWNRGSLESYLIEITAEILQRRDADGKLLVDNILDAAGQKGTGKWTGIEALDLGVPLTLITEAVFARALSALKDERVAAAAVLPAPQIAPVADKQEFAQQVRDALFASKLISYAQGFMMMRAASEANNWNLNYGSVALMWRSGCIIRSGFLDKIRDAYERDPQLASLVVDPWFAEQLLSSQSGWRAAVVSAVQNGIALPAMSSALAFYDGYRSATLPANLLQAQRDYFGAHTYERIDKPRGEYFHTDWINSGAFAQSGSYSA